MKLVWTTEEREAKLKEYSKYIKDNCVDNKILLERNRKTLKKLKSSADRFFHSLSNRKLTGRKEQLRQKGKLLFKDFKYNYKCDILNPVDISCTKNSFNKLKEVFLLMCA